MKIVILFAATLLIGNCWGQTEPCTEGQSYNKDCNTCICTSAGAYACTLRACIDLDGSIVKREYGACSRGSRYYDGCYICMCEKNRELGLHYACHPRKSCSHRSKPMIGHLKAKRDVPAESAGCDKGQFYFDGCNNCVCQGNSYACTLKFCFPDSGAKSVTQPSTKLEPISVRRKRDEAPAAKGCEKGPSYNDGCNDGAEGLYVCSKKNFAS